MVKASTPPALLGLTRVECRATEGPQLHRVRDVLDCSLSPAKRTWKCLVPVFTPSMSLPSIPLVTSQNLDNQVHTPWFHTFSERIITLTVFTSLSTSGIIVIFLKPDRPDMIKKRSIGKSDQRLKSPIRSHYTYMCFTSVCYGDIHSGSKGGGSAPKRCRTKTKKCCVVVNESISTGPRRSAIIP